MLVKAVLVFLLAMAGLAMIGRLLRPKRPPRLPPPARCAGCGEPITRKGGCACNRPPRIGRD